MTVEELKNLKRGDIVILTCGHIPAKVLHGCPFNDVVVIEQEHIAPEEEAKGWNNDGMAVVGRMECYIPESKK
jgi:hypothetical protein